MFYLITIQNDTTQAIYNYDSLSDALAAFHTELAYRAETRVSDLAIILDGFGAIIKKEKWQKPLIGDNKKYYLAIIQNNSAQTISDYTSYDAALVAFHNELAYRNESRTQTVCAILDETGRQILQESYVKDEQ